MWTLIGTGVGAAWVYSVVATLAPQVFPASFVEHGRVGVYFEAAAVIVSLTLLGQMLELQRAFEHVGGDQGAARPGAEDCAAPARRRHRRGRAADARACRRPSARAAGREGAGRRRGARRPLERRRIHAHRGADAGREIGRATRLIGATINGTGSLVMRAEKIGAETVLAQIVQMVAQAQRSRAPMQRMADAVSFWFVLAVLAIAVATFVVWGLFGPEPVVGLRLRSTRLLC